MVLGGLSILGESIFSPLESEERKEIEENLDKARKELNRTASRKATTSLWMKKFMMSIDDRIRIRASGFHSLLVIKVCFQ